MLDDMPQSQSDATFSAVEVLRDGPRVLAASSRLVAKGVGLGSDLFVLAQAEGRVLCERDPLHIRRYIGGVEHNGAPDGWGGRFVFCFQDVVDEAELETLEAGRLFVRRVEKANQIGEYWKYRRSGDGMFALLRKSKFCIIRAQTSSTWTFSFWPKDDIFDQTIIVFGTNCEGFWCILNSSVHEAWAGKYGRLMKTDTADAPSDSFNNLPLPFDPANSTSSALAVLAARYSSLRQKVEMTAGGKTPTYTQFHDVQAGDSDIATLRALHVEMDHAVAATYGWTDIDFGHGFHQTKPGMRYTISEVARRKVLDLLLKLNHERYAQEQAIAAAQQPTRKPKSRKGVPGQSALF
ncbi:MAG: hypothetical protein ABI806_07970 [Candidatus Solibacter sp.]